MVGIIFIQKQRKHFSTILWCVSKILFSNGVMCHVSTNFVILQLQSKLKFMDNNLFNNKYRIPSARAYWHDYNHGISISQYVQTKENIFLAR